MKKTVGQSIFSRQKHCNCKSYYVGLVPVFYTAALGIPFQSLPDYIEGAEQALYTAKKHLERSHTPYALLVKRQTFTPYKRKIVAPGENKTQPETRMTREEAINTFLDSVNDRDVIVGTTGMLSRSASYYTTMFYLSVCQVLG